MVKKGVLMYYDLLEQLKDFNDEQFGKVVRVMIKYDKDGIEPNIEDVQIKLAFNMLKPTIDRNKQEYQYKCDRNRENINKRWNRQYTNEYDGIRTNTNYTDNDIDNDNDIVINKNIEKENILKEKVDWESKFEKLWSIYPRKKNKQLAKKTFEHKIRGLDNQECVDKCNAIYKAQVISTNEWKTNNTDEQFIPHYSSWLNNNVPNSPKYKGR